VLETLIRRAERCRKGGPPSAGDAPADGPEETFGEWLSRVSPELTWDWPHLKYVRDQLDAVTGGDCRKLAIAWPPQHYKTWSTTVRYPLWRMLREPGLRVGVGTYNQRYANKVSRWTRRLVERLGVPFGDTSAVDSWTLANGSSYIARGAGVGLAGEPVDLWVCDDPFKNREAADSGPIQEKVWEWHMDDVTPRIQKGGACIVIHTRWNPADLIGRLQQSEDWPNWRYVRLPAVAESQEERDRIAERQNFPKGLPDPLGRRPGEPLCVGAFDADALADKRRVLGVGFETLYQQNDILRGGSFFSREWFKVGTVPLGEKVRRVRYWDLSSSRKDTADYTSGVLMAKVGQREQARYWVEDVIRGRWSPGERNEVMRQTAEGDGKRAGFERTWFESPAFDKDRAAHKAIMAALSGLPCRGDSVSGQSAGSKQVRAEPVSDAARAGLVGIVAGPWNAAFLTELEGFPKAPHDDQVDSCSGAFNKLANAGPMFAGDTG